jgi:hypothetical protein
MGLLDFFSKSKGEATIQLPKGTFTIDRTGRILTSTLPRAFPQEHVQAIGKQVLDAFNGAAAIGLPLTELTIHYTVMKITAKEQRGGAMVFLAPHGL